MLATFIPQNANLFHINDTIDSDSDRPAGGKPGLPGAALGAESLKIRIEFRVVLRLRLSRSPA
jgi:hypothetical protein